jgi:transporter family-2 protein
VVLALLVGVLVVVQSRINGELGHVVGDGVLAAVIQFGVGLLLLSVIVASRRSTRERLVRALPRELRAGRLRWWQLLGGLGGATLVASQGITVTALGVALFTVLTVAGTTGSSLLVDRIGLGPGGVRPITTGRVLAAVGTTLAVALAVSGRFSSGSLAWSAVLLTLTAGVAVSFQQAVNGQVAMRTGDPLVATSVNFVVGLTALTTVLVLEHVVGSHAWTWPPAPWTEPVLWLGGPIGVAFVVTAAVVVRPLGVLLFSLLTIAGQLAGSLVSDLLVPTAGTVIGWQLVAGVVLTGVAVTVAALRR